MFALLLQLHQFVQNNFTSARMALVGLGEDYYMHIYIRKS